MQVFRSPGACRFRCAHISIPWEDKKTDGKIVFNFAFTELGPIKIKFTMRIKTKN